LPGAYESKEKMRVLCENLNRRHHNAQLAGRASVVLHTVLFFRTKPIDRCVALIMKVRAKGIVVMVPDYGIEAKVTLDFSPNSTDTNTALEFDEKGMSLKCIRTGRVLKVFDQVFVKLEVVKGANYRENLVVSLVEPADFGPSHSSIVSDESVQPKQGVRNKSNKRLERGEGSEKMVSTKKSRRQKGEGRKTS